MHRIATIALLVAAYSTPVFGIFMQPTFAPLGRLANNVEAYLAANPDDAKAYYNLGRIHFLAFYNKSQLVPTTGGKDYPNAAADHLIGGDWLHYERDQFARAQALREMNVETVQALNDAQRDKFYERQVEVYQQLDKDDWKPEPVTVEASLQHALKSLAAFQQALSIEPDNGLFHLGMASLLETIRRQTDESESPGIYRQLAARHYLRAFETALEADSKLETIPITGLQSIVSLEASQAYIRLNERSDAAQIATMKGHIERMQGLRQGPITPVVFTLDGRPYEQLESGNIVEFDLDGDGTKSRWRWIRPDVGILVWAPTDKTPIRSGRQLFGPFTFNQLWSDGYAALAALDDDGDGQLRSGELVGIQVWFDKNSNGMAESVEVVSLVQVGIAAISVDSHRDAAGVLQCTNGIKLEDGRTLRSYDWLAQPSH